MPGFFVGAEGVILLRDEDSYAASRPHHAGLELVTALMHLPLVQLYVHVDTEDIVGAEYFMRMNGIPSASVVPLTPSDRSEEPWMSQWLAIERERSKGPLTLVLTAWGEVFERCLGTYQAALLYARRGGVETIGELPSWDQLRDRVTFRRQAEIEEVDRGLTTVTEQSRTSW